MSEFASLTAVEWARTQFALTALFHWLFVPLTLGLAFLLAFFETLHYRSGNEEWKRIAQFWMRLFAVNFAIGVATGIILEFEFGTNWSNYSWLVGDIFAAPLAAEGIFAFFLESTFFAVMFFGWERVSPRFHLLSTWLVAIGSSLSALWILVANGWMQYPTGMAFNPELARFEMIDFWAILASPVAIGKFVHTTASGFVLAACFVLAVSSWYLLRRRHLALAEKSIQVAAVFGLLSSLYLCLSGDECAYTAAAIQPMKLATFEGLYQGEHRAGLIVAGIANPRKKAGDGQEPFLFQVKIPALLSLLANRQLSSFVPGVEDLVYGNAAEGVMGVTEKMARGKIALQQLSRYREAKAKGEQGAASAALAEFTREQDYMGYGHLQKAEEAVPPFPLVFYSFHLMVGLGTLFPLLFLAYLYFAWRGRLAANKWLLRGGCASFFLALLAGEAGWIVAEVGRQPWAIQGLLPVAVAASNLPPATVATSFFIFLGLFTLLLTAEVRIMGQQIKLGPEEE